MTTDPICSIGEWKNNAELIADVAKLGLIQEPVFDATYGLGVFWQDYKPECLITNDLRKEADYSWDWTRRLSRTSDWLEVFGTVVCDPPYKLNGTSTDTDRYGVDEIVPVKERLRRIEVGAVNCSELVRPGGTLLVKVQDQGANGEMHWQTDMVRDAVVPLGFKKEAAFHLRTKPRPQRSQKRARNNYSTLLVFRRRK